MSDFFRALLASLCLLSYSVQSIETTSTDAADKIENEIFAADELLRFARILEQISQTYVDEISDAELLDMAVRGLLGELDPHSEYLSGERRDAIQQNSEGAYVGVGIELTMVEGDLTIVTPLDESPAARAELRPGDIILRIDDRSVAGMTLPEALATMDEQPLRPLSLTIKRYDEAPFEVSLSRQKVPIKSVSVRSVAHDVGYIRINQFQNTTGEELQAQLSQLLTEHPYLVGLILDLRNNPGGVLHAAVDVSNSFIDSGLIVSTRGRDPNTNEDFYAVASQAVTDLPLVVLINSGSASAAEIVAGAVQDHKRGIILGDISFGKGSVQHVLPLDRDHSIKLTTARYFTPSGRSIQAQGIYPDITVLQGEISFEEKDTFIGEASLNRHLETSDNQAPELLGFREILGDITDIQLSQAVSVLKGMAIYSR